ncbi:MAG: glycosyltransferase family 2 protein [Clostridiales bacterium]|nr:glycosyltransferase family 2 protein [Clostridiales bacterium]
MISVIVPVYNVAGYLDRCVESLLKQDTDRPYEVILVDDGSTDGSGEACDAYAREHPDRIVCVHKPNGGLSSARNEGVRHARGEWIVFVDSDDYVSSAYLSRLDGLRERFDADMSVISIQKTLEGHEIFEHRPRMEDFTLDKKQAFYEMYVVKRFSWYAYGKMYRREAVVKHPFPDGYYEDSATQYLLIDECKKIAFGDYLAEYHYLAREGSITMSRLSDRHMRIFEVCGEVGQYIDSRYPEWDYVKVLLYENAVLQLTGRTSMTKQQYDEIYRRYQKMFRKNVWRIVSNRDVDFGSKYYAVILCLPPSVYRLQRRLMEAVLGKRV